MTSDIISPHAKSQYAAWLYCTSSIEWQCKRKMKIWFILSEECRKEMTLCFLWSHANPVFTMKVGCALCNVVRERTVFVGVKMFQLEQFYLLDFQIRASTWIIKLVLVFHLWEKRREEYGRVGRVRESRSALDTCHTENRIFLWILWNL
jgi:hypothetical protein